MAVKHFIVDPSKYALSKEDIQDIEIGRVSKYTSNQKQKDRINETVAQSKCNLKHIEGRVIVSVDTQAKNWHTFQDGTKIRRERQFNEFNRRITEPVNAIVISADKVPSGSEILISHNAIHESNRIFDYTPISGVFEASDIKYYSLHETDCFAWRDEKEQLRPMKNFCFALRVFKPYSGLMLGIEPTLVEGVLYITTGEFKGNVAHVLKAADYEIIFQGKDGREERVIRCRHFEDEYNEKEELVAIAHDLTDKVISGKLLIGLSTKDANKIVPDN